MRPTANGAVQGRAGPQCARRVGEIEGLIAQFASTLEQLQYRQETNEAERPIHHLRPHHHPTTSSRRNGAGG